MHAVQGRLPRLSPCARPGGSIRAAWGCFSQFSSCMRPAAPPPGADYMKEDYTRLLQRPPAGVTLNILRALRSDRWQALPPAAPASSPSSTANPHLLSLLCIFFFRFSCTCWRLRNAQRSQPGPRHSPILAAACRVPLVQGPGHAGGGAPGGGGHRAAGSGARPDAVLGAGGCGALGECACHLRVQLRHHVPGRLAALMVPGADHCIPVNDDMPYGVVACTNVRLAFAG